MTCPLPQVIKKKMCDGERVVGGEGWVFGIVDENGPIFSVIAYWVFGWIMTTDQSSVNGFFFTY